MTKIAVIIGASRGIGRALTLELANRGIHVFAISQNKEALQNLKSFNPERITIISADITQEEDLNRIISLLQGKKINFLVNNAAIIKPIKPLHQASQMDIRKLLDTNLLGPIFLTNALIPFFHESDSRILNITSVAGVEATSGIMAYCISKAGLNMWTAGLKKELSHIIAADVIPGEVATDMQADLRDAPLEQFPLAAEFKEAEKQQTLIPVTICADFIADILLKTTPKQFSSKTWNIYEDYHNKSIPEPLNKMKLAKKTEVSVTQLSHFSHHYKKQESSEATTSKTPRSKL